MYIREITSHQNFIDTLNPTKLVFQNSVIALFDSTVNISSYFEKGCRKNVHATIPKGIVGGFQCTVLQRNLKEWHGRPQTYVCEC